MNSLLLATAIVVGVIDAGPPADVETVAVSPHPTGSDHGSKIVQAIREETPDARILFADPFEGDMVMDWQIMMRAMIEFKRQGVTHVCTAFTGEDIENASVVAEFADKLGLTIVASMGNDERQTPRLATMPNVVGVIHSEYAHPYRNPAWADAIDYTVSGVIEGGSQGASFASAKVCAKLSKETQS